MTGDVYLTGPGEPAFNMAFDEAMLLAMPRLARPILRFYGWNQPAATFGYSQKYADVEAVTLLRPLIRRPTGGGVVPHDADWTYSLAFPTNSNWYELKAEESYRQVHAWLKAAFGQFNIPTELAPCCKKELPGQCFIGHEKSDLLWHGRKIAGAAQRRTRDGLLIQGSIQPPVGSPSRDTWQLKAIENACWPDGLSWKTAQPDALILESARELTTKKFASSAFNQKR